MSGVVDLNTSRNIFDMIKRIGDTLSHANNQKQYSVISVVEKYPTHSLAIIINCGTEDFLYDIHHALHEKMIRLKKISHAFVDRPGKYECNY